MDNKSDISVPPALDKILDELQSKANEAGYPPRIVLNMRHHPEMLDIMARMIKAELECIKKDERMRICKSRNNQLYRHQ